ncbi:MAG: hypothetical protein KGJ06_08185, partial [Pseudomonadota bacterium]|nr:hypothetical protein [Pseudomonadota bacterium]
TLREIKAGWKKTEAADPLTGERRALVQKNFYSGLGDLKRDDVRSQEYFFNLMAECTHAFTTMACYTDLKRIGNELKKQGDLPLDAIASGGAIQQGFYLTEEDDQLRTPRFFAYQEKVQDVPESSGIAATIFMTPDAAARILGDIFHMPEFMPSPPSPGRGS